MGDSAELEPVALNEQLIAEQVEVKAATGGGGGVVTVWVTELVSLLPLVTLRVT